MKKLFCVFLIFLFTTGCKSKTENIKPIKNNISFDCSISFYNETYECKVTNKKATNFNLKFTFPESINGLEYTIKNSKISSTYKGIEYKTSIENYPPQNLANFIYSVLYSKNDEVFEENNNFYIEDENYKLYVGLTGLPIKITEKSNTINITIKNASLLK